MRSTKKRVVFFIACFLMAMAIFILHPSDEELSVASTPGVVNVTTTLNVRTGPGLDYEILTSSDMSIALKNGTQVSILGTSGEWYRISFKYGSETLKGYVLARYVKVKTSAVETEVKAKVADGPLNVRKRAGLNEEISQLNGVAIRLSKGKQVYIANEKMVDGEKWYYVSFTYNKKSCKGYVLSTYVKLVLDDSVAASVRSTTPVRIKASAGTGAANLLVDGKAVKLSDSKSVSIIKEVSTSGKKWFKIKFQYNGKSRKGFVQANKIRFGKVKEEAESATPKPTKKPETTAEPTATPEVKETEKPEATKSPEAVATPKPLTTKQFKKHLTEQGFPESYKDALLKLHEQYPLWQFNAYQTGLDWNTAVAKESAVGLNLITNSKSSGWKSYATGAYDYATDSFIAFDGSTWVTASEAAVKYYMDPRNFLDSRGIFQFESLQYQKNYQTQDGVEQILYNTPMYKTKYSYEEDEQTKYLLYSKTFIKAAKQSGVSPYHLASRAKQEVVTSSTTMSTSVSGTVSGYLGIYNFYNIGATHSTVAGGAVRNGLSFASSDTTYMRPWNNRKKAIIGGGIYIGENYIARGQDTLYLQKFNVTPNSTYSHQYMANIEAPNAEATKTNTAYGSSKENMVIVFSIPVYQNMPENVCDVPSSVASPNNYLKSLSVSYGSLEPQFTQGDDGSKTYKMTVENNVNNVIISAEPVSSTAKVEGTGSKSLKVGSQTFTIKVTAENGNTRSYKVEVTRKEAAAAVDSSAATTNKKKNDSSTDSTDAVPEGTAEPATKETEAPEETPKTP